MLSKQSVFIIILRRRLPQRYFATEILKIFYPYANAACAWTIIVTVNGDKCPFWTLAEMQTIVTENVRASCLSLCTWREASVFWNRPGQFHSKPLRIIHTQISRAYIWPSIYCAVGKASLYSLCLHALISATLYTGKELKCPYACNFSVQFISKEKILPHH
jgi:hypothetical protein